LKILSVIDIPWNSALAAYAFDQALALRAGGHEVLFACPEGSAAMDFAGKAGFRAFAIPGRKEYHRLPLALLRLRSIIKKEDVNAVCAHTGRAQTLGYLLGLPLVRVKADAKKPSAGFTFSAVDRTIAASDFIKNLYLEAGMKPGSLSVIRQGINIPAVIPRKPAPPYKIGLLGRLDPVKGHDVFLKAAALLLKQDIQAEFHIAGYEANIKYSDLDKTARELGIEKNIFHHGKVDGPYAFMGACDVGVITSLGSEAVSRAALEWLACGKPLVASAVGSLPEFAAQELLVPPGDPAALAAKLETLLRAPGKLKELGEQNRARAERDFSHAAFAAATCALFESLIKKGDSED
jgi:glycosyltransferase involved in cell wall biosynthesis